jgi:WD40 repeat protein
LFGAGFVVLDGHDGGINAMSLSSDGRVATVSGAGCIVVWDPAADWNPSVIRGHTGPIYDVDFAPADDRIVTASKDGTARVWSVGGGEELAVVNVGAEVLHASFSPDGNSFATGASNGEVMIWNSGTGREMISFGSDNDHTAPVTDLEFAPGSERIVTASDDGTAKIWDLGNGTLVAELNHGDLDVPEEGLAASNQVHAAPNQVHAATFSPDGLHVATAAHDGTVRVWDVESGVLVASLDQHVELVEDVEFSPDGQLIVTAGRDGRSLVWAWLRDQVQATFEPHRGHVYSVDVSPDGSSVVSAADDGTARIWDVRSGALEETFAGHPGPVWGARFTPDGKHVATFSADGTARLWERRVMTLAGHDDDVRSAVLAPSGALIATASADGTVRLWDAGDGTFIRSFEDTGAEAKREIYGVAFSPEGDRLVTAASDGSIQLWEVGSGNILQAAERASTAPAVDALYPPGGWPIIGAYADGTLRRWPHGDLKGNLRETRPHSGPIHSLQLSPAGTFFLSVSWDDTAVLFETASGTELHRFEGHEHDVVAAAFSPDEKRVVTGSMDGSARVWDTVCTLATLFSLRPAPAGTPRNWGILGHLSEPPASAPKPIVGPFSSLSGPFL